MTDNRVTQVAVEQWIKGPTPSSCVTQVSAEHWATVAYLDPGAAEMDGAASMTAAGSLVISGAARMDGVAAMAALGTLTLFHSGAAEMDGVASVAFSSIAVTTGAPEMDGAASMAATGAIRISGAAHMDGQAALTATWPLGAANAFMDGTTAVAFTGAAVGPTPIRVILQDGIIGNQLSPKPIGVYHLSLSQSFILIHLPIIASHVFKQTVQGSIYLTDSRVVQLALNLKEVINLRANLVTFTQYYYTFTQPINLQPTPIPTWNAVLSLIQNLTIYPTTAQKYIWGRLLEEIINLSDIAGVGGKYSVVLAQLFKLIQTFNLSRDIILNQAIHLHPSLAPASLLTLLQKVLMTGTASPALRYHLMLAAQVVIEETLGHFAHAILTQLFTVHPALNRQFISNNSLAQLLTVHPALTNKLILQITGNLLVSPAQLVHMLYKGDPLLDGVVIQALYISPSGTTTTWAVNTRTNAVTEYLNYNFHSFALMGNRYIAAGADGLYELEGDTDNGAAIISELMSGYLQLNEKKLFGLKGAYVGIRGGGRFYLKLLSGDGREYVYELRAQPNLMTTKVKIGKGINTTYMAFDLVTEGQDFDLDSIEFIPMTRARRI